jgi:hypothetical protein
MAGAGTLYWLGMQNGWKPDPSLILNREAARRRAHPTNDENGVTLSGHIYIAMHGRNKRIWEKHFATTDVESSDVPLTAEQHIADCACVAIRKTEAWLWLHSQRAEAFGLDAGRDVCSRAACILATMSAATEAKGSVSSSAGWLAAKLHAAVLDIAQAELPYGEYALDHLAELHESGLRAAVGAVGAVASCAGDYHAGYLDALTAVRRAAVAASSAPHAPRSIRECGNA